MPNVLRHIHTVNSTAKLSAVELEQERTLYTQGQILFIQLYVVLRRALLHAPAMTQ
jgi:hypothetical protein